MRDRERGFTLIELMVTLSILVIMIGIGVPMFRTFTANQKVKTASYELMTAIVLARSEAIKRNAAVTFTPSDSSAWAKGWTLADAGGNKLHYQEAIGNVTVSPQSNPGTAATLSVLTFQSNGRPATPSGFANGKVWFQITGDGSTAARCITVDLTGIPSSKAEACS